MVTGRTIEFEVLKSRPSDSTMEFDIEPLGLVDPPTPERAAVVDAIRRVFSSAGSVYVTPGGRIARVGFGRSAYLRFKLEDSGDGVSVLATDERGNTAGRSWRFRADPETLDPDLKKILMEYRLGK